MIVILFGLFQFQLREKTTSGEVKKTKNGKDYLQLRIAGPSGKGLNLKIWGNAMCPVPYTLCCAEIKKDAFGLSTNSFKFKIL
jgi:hypothetical protein